MSSTTENQRIQEQQPSAVLHRNIHQVPKQAVRAKGSYIFLENGQKILDATGGAAVSCLGHGNDEVNQAIMAQLNQISYCHTAFFGIKAFEELATLLVNSTGQRLTKLFVISSGMSQASNVQKSIATADN
jgi:adenosylmethionine-8-amino-7-oxononanoate aminotransferase